MSDRGDTTPGQEARQDTSEVKHAPRSPQPTPTNNGKEERVPFRVLTQLFDKLVSERRPDARRKAIHVWFNVCKSKIDPSRLLTVLEVLEKRHWQ